MDRFLVDLMDTCTSEEESSALLRLDEGMHVVGLAIRTKCTGVLAHHQAQSHLTHIWQSPVKNEAVPPKIKYAADMIVNLMFLTIVGYSGCTGAFTCEDTTGTVITFLLFSVLLSKIMRAWVKYQASVVEERIILPLGIWCILLVLMRTVIDDKAMEHKVYSFGILLVAMMVFPSLFVLNPVMGPLMLTMGKMITDAVSWLLVYVSLIVTFALALTASYTMSPTSAADDHFGNVQSSIFSLFRATFGNFENVLNEDGLILNDSVGTVLLYVFLFITVLMLITLLLAMLTFTFEKVSLNSDVEWRFMRAEAILAYMYAPILPTPLSIISDGLVVFQSIMARATGDVDRTHHKVSELVWGFKKNRKAEVSIKNATRIMRSQHVSMDEALQEYRKGSESWMGRTSLMTDANSRTADIIHDILAQWQLKMVSKEEDSQANTSQMSHLLNRVEALHEKVRYFFEENGSHGK